MERFEINYSKKNIPLPTERDYKIQLVSKVESFTKRMRWKALEFLGKLDSVQKETFGFKSNKCPPAVDDLAAFESDLIMMIKNIEFRPVRDKFQSELKNDMKSINNTDELLIAADKSTNIYKMNKSDYNKYLSENVTKTYKKTNTQKVNKINFEAKQITQKLAIDDRVQRMQENEAFITLKDHKEGFPHRLSFRLINPTKSEIGKISKTLLDKINVSIKSTTKVNQWKNTSDVLTWFDNITNKRNASFINFDVESFYPSISMKLFTESINFAKSIIDISDQDLSIIMQARKTLLFQQFEPWVKKTGNEDFDVPMGCYDGAEVCELIGSYILSKLGNIINKNDIGLYRDDGLGNFKNKNKPEIERTKNQLLKYSKIVDFP